MVASERSYTFIVGLVRQSPRVFYPSLLLERGCCSAFSRIRWAMSSASLCSIEDLSDDASMHVELVAKTLFGTSVGACKYV